MQSITQPNSARWIQVLTMPFITMKRMVGLGLLNSKQPSKEESSGTKLLHRINDVPLSVFIDCICDNDYKGLIISGKPTNEEIATAFEAIYEQYIEAVGGKDLLRHIRQMANLDMWYKVHSDEVLSQVKQDIENELNTRHGRTD
jgi:hypothetical protein